MSRGRIVAIALLWLAGLYALFALFQAEAPRQRVPYSPTFVQEVRQGNVERVSVKGDAIEGRFAKPVSPPGGEGAAETSRFKTAVPQFADRQRLRQLLRENDVTVFAEPAPEKGDGGIGLLPLLLLAFAPVLLLIGFLVWAARRSGAMGGGGGGPLGQLGKSRARRVEPTHEQVRFDDVAGIDEAREELEQIVGFLREPERFRGLGARIPRGVLLLGAPGTGKTLLARALAGEASVPFFSVAATEFVEMIVGVGASRVRDMFQRAKESAPSVVFIDELDAVGRRRSGGGGMSGANDEREQTLNQILAEMDGFETGEAVMVLGATNRAEDLDEALTRPGRFDRRVVVQAPDREGRRSIFGVHTRHLPLGDDVDADALARATPGMVGADIANLTNEAALMAASREADRVEMRDFQAALDKIALGSPRGVFVSEEDRRLAAYHEAGHALAAMLTPGADPVRKVTVVPRGRSLGATMATPDMDRLSMRRDELLARMRVLLGGRTAEELAFEEVSSGAEDDLEQVTGIARMMVGRWGMASGIGPLSWIPREARGPMPTLDGRQPSERTRTRVDEEVERLVGALHEDLSSVLSDNRDKLDALAEALLEHETLDQDAAYRAAGVGGEGMGATGFEPVTSRV